jgi:hypothetical protein
LLSSGSLPGLLVPKGYVSTLDAYYLSFSR